ncbi:DENN (AEX-3) domain containing protein, partial [Entamoeba histolytica HM-3:IMSS]
KLMNQEYPLVVSFFEIDNHTELPIQSFPFKHQIDKNFFRFFFPIAPSYLHSSFLCIDSQQQMFCYVKQTDDCTFVLTSQYLHWSLFINILLHLIQLPSPQRVLFLSSLHHLIPLPTLNQLNYPLFSFHSHLPQPINQPSSGCLSSLLCLPITQLMMLFSSILNERRIIIQSNSAQKISEFIVSLLEIFSPLKWQHLLVPFLPIKYTELTETPTPFIIGVDPSIMEIIDLFDIIVFVDIDKGIIKSTDSTIIKSDYELIPSKWINSINNTLKPIYSNSETVDDKNIIIKKAFNELMNCFIKELK